MRPYAWRRVIDTRYYLLHIWGDVEPSVLGPYRTEAELTDGTRLPMKPYDIDELAERFPDCKVGY